MPPVRGKTAKRERGLWFSYCKEATFLQPWGAPKIMLKVAYTIAEAATVTSTTVQTITEAIREDQLTARSAGKLVIVGHTALMRWYKTLPKYVISS